MYNKKYVQLKKKIDYELRIMPMNRQHDFCGTFQTGQQDNMPVWMSLWTEVVNYHNNKKVLQLH